MGERPTDEAFMLTINNANNYREAFQAAQAEACRARTSEESKSAELKAAHELIGRLQENLLGLETLLQSKDAEFKALAPALDAAEGAMVTALAGLDAGHELKAALAAIGRARLGLALK